MLLLAASVVACAPAVPAVAPDRDARPPRDPERAPPPAASAYGDDAIPRSAPPTGVDARLDHAVREAFAERSPGLAVDARLDALARWIDCRENDPAPSGIVVEAAADRLGLVDQGITVACVAGPPEGSLVELVRPMATSVPTNVPITHAGVAGRAIAGGFVGTLVVSSREARVTPIPRMPAPGSTVVVEGTVAERFTSTRLAITLPSGAKRSEEGPTAFRYPLKLTETGVHRVELLGDGPSGPVVVLNVPLFVGVPEPPIVDTRGGEKSDEGLGVPALEARLLGLVNAERQKSGLAPVAADETLADVARGHSKDMSDNGFFGHISKTTGRVDDRALAAHVDATLLGENVALASSVATAHQTLLESPAHRAAIVDPDFTHVGIGIVRGADMLYVTEVFARRPPPVDAKAAPAAIRAMVDALRQKEKLPKAAYDVALESLAQASADAVHGGDDVAKRAVANVGERIRKRRLAGVGAVAVVVRETSQIEAMDWGKDATLGRYGIGVARIDGAPGAVVVIVRSSVPRGGGGR